MDADITNWGGPIDPTVFPRPGQPESMTEELQSFRRAIAERETARTRLLLELEQWQQDAPAEAATRSEVAQFVQQLLRVL